MIIHRCDTCEADVKTTKDLYLIPIPMFGSGGATWTWELCQDCVQEIKNTLDRIKHRALPA